MKEEGAPINVLVGLLLINFANATATLGGAFFVNKFGQKPALVCGLSILTICWIVIIVGNILKQSYVVMVFIMLFCVTYQMTMGPIGFVHILETCHPSLIGFHYFLILSNIIALSFVAQWIRESFGNT